MNFIRRHLTTLICLGLLSCAIWGWWHSSRVWMAVNAETPFGIFRWQSESSMFGIGAQFMRHDHRWAIHSSPDEITGDKMKFLPDPPKFSIKTDLLFLILPYWQLALSILTVTVCCFVIENRLLKRRQKNITNRNT